MGHRRGYGTLRGCKRVAAHYGVRGGEKLARGDGYEKRKQDNFIDLAFQDETELLIIGLQQYSNEQKL